MSMSVYEAVLQANDYQDYLKLTNSDEDAYSIAFAGLAIDEMLNDDLLCRCCTGCFIGCKGNEGYKLRNDELKALQCSLITRGAIVSSVISSVAMVGLVYFAENVLPTLL